MVLKRTRAKCAWEMPARASPRRAAASEARTREQARRRGETAMSAALPEVSFQRPSRVASVVRGEVHAARVP